MLVRPYYGINVHTDAQGEYGTVLGSNDVFPDLPLITAATILNESDSHEVKVIDAVTGFPEDTWETLHATYRYADTVNSDIAAFNEYTEFNLSSESDISPDIFCSFENATTAKGLSSLSKEEIRYAVELFSTMYTLKHDPLEKAYNYNHKQLCDSRRLASKLKGHENDLDELSRIIRESS